MTTDWVTEFSWPGVPRSGNSVAGSSDDERRRHHDVAWFVIILRA